MESAREVGVTVKDSIGAATGSGAKDALKDSVSSDSAEGAPESSGPEASAAAETLVKQ